MYTYSVSVRTLDDWGKVVHFLDHASYDWQPWGYEEAHDDTGPYRIYEFHADIDKEDLNELAKQDYVLVAWWNEVGAPYEIIQRGNRTILAEIERE